jgi:tryptophan halogenase
LRAQAAAAGVAFVSGDIGAVEQRDDGGVAALRLTGGERVEADWFIDCTGPAARLFGTIASEFEDWSAWMPFDRLSFITAPANGEPATADRISGGINGWAIEWPLRNRTLSASVGRDGEVEIARGRRLRPFLRNVLALGDAAVALDPLHGFHLELAQSAISLALELLPGRDFHELETQEYNRRAEQVTRRVRDFVALHYARAPGRSLIAAEPPDSLAGTLDQYEHRGRMPFHEDESVSRDSWTAALLGLGVVPHNVDPAAAAVPLADAVAAMDRLVEEIDQTVAALPAYGDYLARIAP